MTRIRGNPNSRRQAIIDNTFLKFDKEGNGVVYVTDQGCFNCLKHLKILNGEMNEDQVFGLSLRT
jgi:hypothetical protein